MATQVSLSPLLVIFFGFVLGALILSCLQDRLGYTTASKSESTIQKIRVFGLQDQHAFDDDTQRVAKLQRKNVTTAGRLPTSFTRMNDLSLLLKMVAKDGQVIMTTTDSGYVNMTLNWICHMKALHIEKEVIVFALDSAAHTIVQSQGIASYFEPKMSKESNKIGTWNSKSYNQVVHTKTKHQKAVLDRGFDIFFTDVDIPWTSDYREQVIKEAAAADFVGQQNWPQCDMNTGFLYMKRYFDLCCARDFAVSVCS